MGPYDNDDIYDDQKGLGKRSSSAPDFEPPQTYPSAPDIHDSEAAATNGDTSSDESVNSATQKEQSAFDSGIAKADSFVKDIEKLLPKGKGGFSMLAARRRGIMIGVGLVAMMVITIMSILFTFNIPSAEIRAAGNGLITTYFGSQIMQGKIHMGKYWNGMIDDTFKQTCLGKDCTISMDGKSSMLERWRTRTSANFVENLKKAGIAISSEGGKITGYKINTEVEGTKYSGITDPDDLKKVIKETTGIDVTVKGTEQPSLFGDTFDVKATDKSAVKLATANKSIAKGFLSEAGYDKLFAKWTPIRQLSSVKGFGFNPLRELRSKTEDKVNSAVDKWVQSLLDKISGKTPNQISATVNETDKDGKVTTANEDGKLSYEGLKEGANKILESKGGKVGGGALAVAGLLCVANELIKGTSDLKVTNYYNPTSQLATTMMAASDQTTAVSTPGMDSAGQEAYVKTFLERKDDQGNIVSFSDSATWKAMNGVNGGTAIQAGDAVAAGLKSAQSNSDIQKGLAAFVEGLGTAVCSGPTGTVVAGAGIILMVISGPFAVLEGAAFAAVFALGVPLVTQILAGSAFNVAESIKDPARTYNNAAQGARYTADLNSWTHGGTPQASTDNQKYKTQYLVEQTNDFKSKSIAYQLFNTSDPLSAVNKIASKGSVYPSKNIATLANSFVNIIPNIAKSFGTLLSPKASAASTTIDPCNDTEQGCSGLSSNVMNDDGSKAIAFFNNNPDIDASDWRLTWMKDCHDDEFYKNDLGAWDFRIVQDTPAYTSYITDSLDQKCNDSSNLNNPDILALLSYVNLAPQAAGAVCQDATADSADDLDKAACNTVGYSASPDTPSSSTPATGPFDEASWKRQFSNGNISESSMTKITKEFLVGSDSSDPVGAVNICKTWISEPFLNPNAAISIKAMNDAFKAKFGHSMYFQSCYRSYDQQKAARSKLGNTAADPGTSNHGWGLAIDIGPNPKKDQGCDSSLGGSDKEQCSWILQNASNYGYKTWTVKTEMWHLKYVGGS